MYFHRPTPFPLHGWKEGCLASAVRISLVVSRAWLPNHAFIFLGCRPYIYTVYLRWSVIESSDLWLFCVRAKVFWTFLLSSFFLPRERCPTRAVPTAYICSGFYHPFRRSRRSTAWWGGFFVVLLFGSWGRRKFTLFTLV